VTKAAKMSLREQVGQLLWIGFEGTTFSRDLARLVKDVAPGGIILFGRNLTTDPRQIRALTDALHRASAIPPFIALDQEGGRVSRLREVIGPSAPPAALAARCDATMAVRRQSEATAIVLRGLGFNVNFAPVLDLSTPEARNGIGDRGFGDSPRCVALLAGLFAAAHTRSGVLPVGKHFPGLGGAQADTHMSLPVIRRTRAALLRQDLLPYRRLRRALPILMIGHACYPAVQGRNDQPASLSPAVIEGLLRRTVGYRGLVLTDDLEMGAIDPSLPGGTRALLAFQAGSDGLMFCKSEDRIRQASETLVAAVQAGKITPARLRASLRRVLALKKRSMVRRRHPRLTAAGLTRARTLFAGLLAGTTTAGPDPTARD
jgi:beta-N-acetylhexosaminidase